MAMLQAHSILWHYLWVAPDVLMLALAALLWRRGAHRNFPAFFAFAVLASVGGLIDYAADLAPSVSGPVYWRIAWATWIIEGVLKFAVIGEIFAHALGSYDALARMGRQLIQAVGVVLVAVAAIVAAYVPNSDIQGPLLSSFLLEQAVFLVETGLLVTIFLLLFYFHLSWGHQILGIALGLGISSCVHLATWAMTANGVFAPRGRILLDFVNMATYHCCVLLWLYFLLVPKEERTQTRPSIPENNLALWNRELERLLHQ